jgi:preprotein translocase subunit YajC
MFSALIGGFEILLVLFLLPLCLAMFVFWVWMLIDAIQHNGLSDGEKIGWVLAIIFLHFLAALLYFFIGRPKKKFATAVG